ncbi:MAG: glycosyltransferase family 41 protein [Rhodoferax sp.]|nr:glycosyltransferase family 41 protein [Rhodoferax sp.]
MTSTSKKSASKQHGIHSATHALRVKFNQALALHQSGQWTEAHSLYQAIVQRDPKHFDALHMSGVIAHQRGDSGLAANLISRALAVNPWSAAAHSNKGAAQRAQGQHADALASFDRAIGLSPGDAMAHMNRGLALLDLHRHEEALASSLKAVSIKADYAQAHLNCGVALEALRQFESALESAELSYRQAVALDPHYSEAHYNLGNVLGDALHHQAALASFDQAIALNPGLADAHHGRGLELIELKRQDEALASFAQVAAICPDYPELQGIDLLTRLSIGQWDGCDQRLRELSDRLGRGELAYAPLVATVASASPKTQQQAAKLWIQHKFPPVSWPLLSRPQRTGVKIRVAYFSADFGEHPVSYLMAEVFEMHDRSQFELYAFALGPRKADGMTGRIAANFDAFIEVGQASDREIAQHARHLAIDIAVDLGGHTLHGRTGVFAQRAAPIQVSYIGYLGTTGAAYYDYLLADDCLIPEQHQAHYCEKILYLPSYQANDRQRAIADHRFARSEIGLPSTGFVYCCFNNNFKISPSTFDGWMRILAAVEGSGLMLYADNPFIATNLKKEAAARQIAPYRLVFVGRLPRPLYLARYMVADLFLDTLPYNAGATASDALWAGLPVLTCRGESLASRMAASLLTAIELPELIIENQADFETLAIELAQEPQRLQGLRDRLAANRHQTPLFDTPAFTRSLESGFIQMLERHWAALPPEHIHVKPA